jgi:pimeloyl-ACP methyl ester carboxylesterase
VNGWIANTRGADQTEFAGGFCTMGETQLRASASEPAYAELNMVANSRKETGQPVTSSWLLAECHWAACFPAPSAGEVIAWGCPVVPWAVASHFAKSVRDGSPATWLWVLLFALPLTLAVEVLLVLIAVLSRVPTGPLKPLVSSAEQIVAGFVGDVYVYAASPTRLAAILTRFRRDLDWLEARCRTVVVVAHSQGGAVVMHGLLVRSDPKLKLVATLGSGIYKLLEQKWKRVNRVVPVDFVIHLVCWLTALVAIYRFAAAPFTWGALVDATEPILVVNALFAGFVWLTYRYERADQLLAQFAKFELPKPWLDFYASADPVSNGPLPGGIATESYRVQNFGSLLFDHTGYIGNRMQLLAPLVSAVARACSPELPLNRLTGRDEQAMQNAAAVQCWMVRHLVALRWAFIAMAGWAAFRPPPFARAVAGGLLRLDLGGWFSKQGLSAVCAAAAVALGYGAVVVVWRTAMGVEAQFLEQRVAGGRGPVSIVWVYLSLVLLAGALVMVTPVSLPGWVLWAGVPVGMVFGELLLWRFDRATRGW